MSEDSEFGTVMVGGLVGGLLAGGPIGFLAALGGYFCGKAIKSAYNNSHSEAENDSERETFNYSSEDTDYPVVLPKINIPRITPPRQTHLTNHPIISEQYLQHFNRDEEEPLPMPTPRVTPRTNYTWYNVQPTEAHPRENRQTNNDDRQNHKRYMINECGEIFEQ
ncbi:MAG: hypothetical protein WC614_12375 [bacterium]